MERQPPINFHAGLTRQSRVFFCCVALLLLGSLHIAAGDSLPASGAELSTADSQPHRRAAFAPSGSAQPLVESPMAITAALGQLAQTPSAEIAPESLQQAPPGRQADEASPLREASPVFISAGLAQLHSVLFYQAGVGFSVADRVSLFAGGGFGPPNSAEANEKAVRLGGFTMSALALYHLTENFRVGLGGGLVTLYGQYDALPGRPRPEVFKVSAPFISAVAGFQLQFVLITVGVSYVF